MRSGTGICGTPSIRRAKLSIKRSSRALLLDADQSAAAIGKYIEDLNAESYSTDGRTHDAVRLNLIVIGEELNRLHQVSPELADRIPKLRRIVDFRNLLVHGYSEVQPDRV